MKKLQIGVIGSAGWEEYPGKKPKKSLYEFAYSLGKLIGKENAILICGGMGGIMLEACRGAKENNGITVGVISGNKRNKTNKYVDVEIVSGMLNHAEESTIVSMSDGIIAIGGGAGSLQEIAIAYRIKKPLIAIKGVNGWSDKVAGTYLDERKSMKIESAKTPKSAFDKLLKMITKERVKTT